MKNANIILLFIGLIWSIGIFAETDYDAIEALDDLDEIEPEQEEFTVTHEQYCDGCKTMMEGYFFAINREIKKNSKTPDAHIDGARIAEKLCHSDSFEPFDQYIKRSCAKLMNENHKDLLMPLAGQVNLQTGLLMQDVGRHLKKSCKQIGACSDDMVHPKYGKKTKCDACQVVANDIDFVIRREEKLTTARIEDLLDEVCRHLPLRHEEPAFLEDMCFTIMDDLSDHLPNLLESYDNQRRSGATSVTSIADEVCTKKMKLCTTNDETKSHKHSKKIHQSTKEKPKRKKQKKQNTQSNSQETKKTQESFEESTESKARTSNDMGSPKGKTTEDLSSHNDGEEHNNAKNEMKPTERTDIIEEADLVDDEISNDKDEL